MKILITGVGGSGKTTTIKELSSRGNIGIDLDDTHLCFWMNKDNGEKVEYLEVAGGEWLDKHSWRLDVGGLKNLLETFNSKDNIYIGGKIAKSQLKDLEGLFDKIFLLSPSDNILRDRQDTRIKENNFARSKSEQIHVRDKRKKFEEECIRLGGILIDADKSVEEILNKITNH